MSDYLSLLVQKILQAPVYKAAEISPLELAPNISEKLGNDIRLKREDLQRVTSFKIRGAYNCMANLDVASKEKGVITASAGNHAQGIAYSSKLLEIKSKIVMPITTPSIKVDAVKKFGGSWAEVLLVGENFDQAKSFAINLSQQEYITYVPPFDHIDVIAGQGTVGKEVFEQWQHIDYIFVPVGGGGLIAGIAAYLSYVAPEVQVIGVEHEESACLTEAIRQGKRVILPHVGLFCDGVAVSQIGEITFNILNSQKPSHTAKLLEEVVTCSNDEVCAAVKDIYDENRSIVEPSGALALAGLKKYLEINSLKNKKCVAVVSGSNMDFDTLRYISERNEIGEKKEAIFAVKIPEQKGAFLNFCRSLEGRRITEFNYRFNPFTIDSAAVFVGIGLKEGKIEHQLIIEKLNKLNYQIFDLTDDEIAKNHIRHLIGGHLTEYDELLFSITFPERPNALLSFLEKLGNQFNISLFHYRNHGAAEGRVIIGFQENETRLIAIMQALNMIGYDYQDITNNIGYQIFLG